MSNFISLLENELYGKNNKKTISKNIVNRLYKSSSKNPESLDSFLDFILAALVPFILLSFPIVIFQNSILRLFIGDWANSFTLFSVGSILFLGLVISLYQYVKNFKNDYEFSRLIWKVILVISLIAATFYLVSIIILICVITALATDWILGKLNIKIDK